MAVREARRKDGIEAVAIVTPNHLHYPIAREFLKRKIHVICDKPLTSTLADAKKLVKLVLYVYVRDADATCQRAVEAGAEVMEPPLDTPYGDRRAMVRDRWVTSGRSPRGGMVEARRPLAPD